VVIAGAGGNFCPGGDVHEIIGPLVGTICVQTRDFARAYRAFVARQPPVFEGY
jgi:enoyl-CoA hydratase/carnithine racemase